MITTDALANGTIVRNTKSGKLARIIKCEGVSEGDPNYLVTSVKDGKRFGPLRNLRGSQMELLEGDGE